MAETVKTDKPKGRWKKVTRRAFLIGGVTTAGGLAVAIPTQLAYNYFMSRINKFVRDIETSANMLLETFGEMERSGVPPESGGDAS